MNKTIEERAKELWRMALTYAANVCTQISDEYNGDDHIEAADAAIECKRKIVRNIADPHPDFTTYIAGATENHPAEVEGLHPDSANLLKVCFEELRAKMAKSEKKYGWTNEWLTNDWEDECRKQMIEHLKKGDPRDVAIYAMFMMFRGWSTKPAEADGWRKQELISNEGWKVKLQFSPTVPKPVQDKFLEVIAEHLLPAPPTVNK